LMYAIVRWRGDARNRLLIGLASRAGGSEPPKSN
jgi:hypothetical protein